MLKTTTMKPLGFFLLIFLISCSNKTDSKKANTDTKSHEILAEISLQPDSTFNDFILQFGFNPDFQKSRIKFPLAYINLGTQTTISASSWTNDRLYVELEAITDVSNGIKTNEKSKERVFSWINPQSGISKNYYFKKDKDKWFLLKIEIRKNSVNLYKEDFYTFLNIFCKDSVFQKQRIEFPLDMTYLDCDFNEVKEKRIQEKWRYTGFYYNCDSIATLYYDFQRTFLDTDQRVLIIHGVENGISSQFTFKRVNHKWIMIKYEDYST